MKSVQAIRNSFSGQVNFLVESHVSFIFFTFEVLVPEFLMPYSPSCGGMGLSLNNLQGKAPSLASGHPCSHMNTCQKTVNKMTA